MERIQRKQRFRVHQISDFGVPTDSLENFFEIFGAPEIVCNFSGYLWDEACRLIWVVVREKEVN